MCLIKKKDKSKSEEENGCTRSVLIGHCEGVKHFKMSNMTHVKEYNMFTLNWSESMPLYLLVRISVCLMQTSLLNLVGLYAEPAWLLIICHMADETLNIILQVGQGEWLGPWLRIPKKSSDYLNAQNAVCLDDTRETLISRKVKSPFSCVCSLRQSVSCDHWQWHGGGGSKGGVWPGMSRRHTDTHTRRATTWTRRQIAGGGVVTCGGHLVFGARSTVGQEKSLIFGTAICQRSLVVPKGTFKY